MKRMATKLLRLTADEKKEVRKGTHSLTGMCTAVVVACNNCKRGDF